MSFGITLGMGDSNNGNRLLTEYVDWSAQTSHDDVLYVISGNESSPMHTVAPIPKDNFNGMTVGASTKGSDGKYDTVATFNDYTQDADGDRTSISLIAPGQDVLTPELSTASSSHSALNDGTSFAAPHVTGTVALMQDYAERGHSMHLPKWQSIDYRHHQVMKAVLLNSADKVHLQSDLPATLNGIPMLTVPTGGFLDQDRTAIRQDGGNWFSDTAAADKSFESGGLQPLDDQFGAGELDAKRALTQFTAGEYHSYESGGPTAVPVIGWDYGHSAAVNQVNTYSFNQQLVQGSFISITLAFDRVVQFATGGSGNVFHSGDTFQKSTDFQTPGHDQFSDLDLFLIDTTTNQTEAVSTNGDSTIEHIFWQIQQNDNYEIEVEQHNNNGGPVDYGLAWWTLGTGPLLSGGGAGDVNQDGHVDAKDIAAMENALANETGYASLNGISTDELSLLGDVNGDGVFNNADLQSLIGLLKSGGGSTSVPEPGSFLLLALSGLALVRARKWN